MNRLAHVLTVCLLVAAAPAAAGLVVEQVSQSATYDCDHPSVGVSPDGVTIVAWQDWVSQIRTAGYPTVPSGSSDVCVPQDHGQGVSPRVVWTWQGLLLVWIYNTGIKYTFAQGTEFPDPPEYIETWISLHDTVLDVRGTVEPGWDIARIAFEAPSAPDGRVALLILISTDGPEGISLIAEDLEAPVRPQLADVPGPYQPLSRVYYLREAGRLAYRTELLSGDWLEEVLLPELDYGVEFDVDADATGAQSILALGPQPVGPCNVVHATIQDADGTWHAPEPLTVTYAAYDWPQSPCVRRDSQGRTHAFWMQIGSDEELHPQRRDLEYWVCDASGWSDRGQDLDLHEAPGIGERVAMDLTTGGQAVFAWTVKDTVNGIPQPRQIMLARPEVDVPVPQDAPPRVRASLDAWPNPFNPRLMIRGTVPVGSVAALAVHDLGGRRVTRLAAEPAADGVFAATWDGRDGAGRTLPSGTYVLRLATGTDTATRRVVLAR